MRVAERKSPCGMAEEALQALPSSMLLRCCSPRVTQPAPDKAHLNSRGVSLLHHRGAALGQRHLLECGVCCLLRLPQLRLHSERACVAGVELIGNPMDLAPPAQVLMQSAGPACIARKSAQTTGTKLPKQSTNLQGSQPVGLAGSGASLLLRFGQRRLQLALLGLQAMRLLHR